MNDTDLENKQLSSVVRTFAILEAFKGHGFVGITELSKQTRLSKATVHRFLQTLKALGYVVQEDDSEKYGLALKLFELATGALSNIDLIRIADAEMRKIATATRETVHLGVLEHDSFIYTHKIDSQYTLRMHSRIGSRNALYSTGIGKVLLAGMSDEQFEQYINKVQFNPVTLTSITNKETLRARIVETKLQGYGEDKEEQELGVCCIAVPLYDRFNQVCASISISYPTLRGNSETHEYYISLLKNAGKRISEQLGSCAMP